MKNIFISGTPRSGKTTLAGKIGHHTGLQVIKGDDIGGEILEQGTDKSAIDAASFFFNQDEEQYWKKTKCNGHIDNLKKKSETIWPYFVREAEQTKEPFVIEGVDIFPHLAHQDFDFPGIVLLRKSLEGIYKSIKEQFLWSEDNDALKKKEAEVIFCWETPFYEQEAKKYGYKVFTDLGEAEKEILDLIKE